MRLDVFFTPHQAKPADTAARLVVIVDVLRASTTVATALGNGAKTVMPLEGADEVIFRSKEFARSQIILAGEQKMHPITGFDLGNSPQDFTKKAVEGKTILITTTNGTRALLGVQGARDIVIASYVNFTAVLAMMKVAASSNTDIAIICAGEEGSFTLEDAACAGRYVRAIPRRTDSVQVNDAAAASVLIEKKYGDNIEKVFKESSHGQALAEAGFGDDLAAAAEVDSYPVVPIYQERQITKLGPERAR
ncbi:MAG TPA: 2-phosphosulfolactate phosphatase [Gemmatimonadaceae bacterium]|nr:2-phosphosulfolactate phosphatase [Gemmatimonadaceae bacterium]